VTKPVEIPEAVEKAIGRARNVWTDECLQNTGDRPWVMDLLRREIAKAILLARADTWEKAGIVNMPSTCHANARYDRERAAALGEEGERRCSCNDFENYHACGANCVCLPHSLRTKSIMGRDACKTCGATVPVESR
jgi:hypothetical protein